MTIESVTFTGNETGPNAPETTPAVDPNRPEWLPQNFQKPEDMARSYAELQAEFTRTKQALAAAKGEAPADPATETPPAAEDAPAEDPAQKAANAAGLDITPYSAEYEQTGDVSEENRVKIADGLKSLFGEDARSIVDQYIEGQKAAAANDYAMYMDTAGGEENYKSMVTWAAGALPKNEIEALNTQLGSTDKTAVTFALTTLRTKYEAANGIQPNILTGNSGGVSSVSGFKSVAEMTAAMDDPRYKKDPAYRELVRQRIAAGSV